MLIKALCDYYDILAEKGEVIEEGFCMQPVSYMVFLRPDGSVSEIADIRIEKTSIAKNGKKKSDFLPVAIKLPFRERSTTIKAYKIDHRSRYIFGLNYEDNILNPEDNKNSAKISHGKFIEENLSFIEGIDSPVVNAYRNFINHWRPEEETENELLIKLGKAFSDSGFCFALDGHPEIKLHEDSFVLKRVLESVESVQCPTDDMQFCAITGEKDRIARLHNNVKGLMGQKAGTFVCVNNPSEESFGKVQAYNSSVSETAMKKYTEAFNTLSGDPRYKAYIDGMTVLYWAMSKESGVEVEAFSALALDKPDTPEQIQNSINKIMEYTLAGKHFDLANVGINADVEFYIAGFVPNSSRVSQKFVYHNKFGKIFENVLKHQKDMALETTKKHTSIGQIARELKPPKAKRENTPPALVASIFGSVINGTRYPHQLLETVIRRVKTDTDDEKSKYIKINNTRIGIIKACINRNARFLGKEEEIKMSLDKENTNAAYLCGRLFAVLEKVQTAALGELNTGIKDAYFASACSKPAVVFPRIIKLSQNHMAKIRSDKKELAGYFNKTIGEIIGMLDTEFPNTLSLEDQGKFIMGYYHQLYFKKSNEN